MAGNDDRKDKPAKPPAPSDSPPAVRRLSRKKWIPVAFDRRRGALLAMGISAAARELAKESLTAQDCAGPMTDRWAEKLLRDSGAFPQAYRGGLSKNPRRK
jgi:hypothetical protein